MTTGRPKRAAVSSSSLSIQSWYEHARGRGFGDADDRNLRRRAPARRDAGRAWSAPACCRTTRAPCRSFRSRSNAATSRALGSVSFMMASWKRSLRIVSFERFRHVAEHRLGRRDRRAGKFVADGGDLVVERRKRGDEGLQPRRIFVLVRRIGRGERRGERARQPPAWWPDRTRGADCRPLFRCMRSAATIDDAAGLRRRR